MRGPSDPGQACAGPTGACSCNRHNVESELGGIAAYALVQRQDLQIRHHGAGHQRGREMNGVMRPDGFQGERLPGSRHNLRVERSGCVVGTNRSRPQSWPSPPSLAKASR